MQGTGGDLSLTFVNLKHSEPVLNAITEPIRSIEGLDRDHFAIKIYSCFQG
jgi:hypothetical protein